MWYILNIIIPLCNLKNNIKQIKVMDAQKVDAFIMANGKFFPDYQVAAIRDMLLAADDSKWSMLQVMQFKDPTICLIISLFAGSLGIDRFFIGDTGLGIAKLITCGGFGIWTIVDWFLIMGAARDKNMQKPGMYGLPFRPYMRKRECGEGACLSSYSIFLVLHVVLHEPSLHSVKGIGKNHCYSTRMVCCWQY